jgi:N-ethylmaleimide reductase
MKLFEPLKLGELTLKNRVIMAPLTRMRSMQPGNIPWELNALYYSQRSSAGLIISEATQISQQGQGYPATPGIYSEEQVKGWRKVTEAVHSSGGFIFAQLWHVGRISHSSLQPDGGVPVAPSAIKPAGGTFSADYQQVAFETPRALTTEEIHGIANDYYRAALNAKSAGFDGIEIHSANGYLLDQFLQDGSNKREDEYGGSIENRARLLMEVINKVAAVWNLEKIGVRLSPHGTFNDMKDSNPLELFSYVISELSNKGLGYLHLVEPRSSNAGGRDGNTDAPEIAAVFRKFFKGILISAGGHTGESAESYVANNLADAIAFGRYFISNPDLPQRIRQGAELSKYDRSTFYGGKEEGYTDYPFLTSEA